MTDENTLYLLDRNVHDKCLEISSTIIDFINCCLSPDIWGLQMKSGVRNQKIFSRRKIARGDAHKTITYGGGYAFHGNTHTIDVSYNPSGCSVAIPNSVLTINPFQTAEIASSIYNAFKEYFSECCDKIDGNYIFNQLMSRAFLYVLYMASTDFFGDPHVNADNQTLGIWQEVKAEFQAAFGDEGPYGKHDINIGKPSFDPTSANYSPVGILSMVTLYGIKKINPSKYVEIVGSDRFVYDPFRTSPETVDKLIEIGVIPNRYGMGKFWASTGALMNECASLDAIGTAAATMTWMLGGFLVNMHDGKGPHLNWANGSRIDSFSEDIAKLLEAWHDKITNKNKKIPSAIIVVKIEDDKIDEKLNIHIQSALRSIDEFSYQWNINLTNAVWNCSAEGESCISDGRRKKYYVYTNHDIWGFDVMLSSNNNWSGSVSVFAALDKGVDTLSNESNTVGTTVNVTPEKTTHVKVGTLKLLKKNHEIKHQGITAQYTTYECANNGFTVEEWNPVQQYHGRSTINSSPEKNTSPNFELGNLDDPFANL